MVADQFGITLKYPSSETNNQFYAFPHIFTNVSQVYGSINSRVATSGDFVSFSMPASNAIVWWEYTPPSGDDAYILITPSSIPMGNNGSLSLDVNCQMDHQETHQRGYVNNEAEWQNVEITSHLFIKTVSNTNGYVYFEARIGDPDEKEGGCCQDTAYGVRLYWHTGSNKGKFSFYKKHFTGSLEDLPLQSQTTIPSFYQTWFAAKFVIYNIQQTRVKLELWLTPISFGNPSHSTSNVWTKVGEVEDFAGKGWGNGGKECDATTDDAPITWAAPFVAFGWKDGKIIQFNYTSFREIDPSGSFGQDPDPPENPPSFPDPTLPDPDPDPVEPPAPPPIDTTPPQTPQTMVKRFTMRREVVNNTQCKCDGILATPDPEEPPPGGGGGGGGGGGTTPPTGGGGTFTTIYNVPLSTAAFGRLATVSGNTGYYLRFGQACTRTSSTWLGKTVNRVEITIAKQGTPTGNITCVVRRASNDTVAATLTPTKSAAEISTSGTALVFENLTNTYQMQLNDKVLIEFAGGDINNFVKVFMDDQSSTSGTKVMFQRNTDDSGEYGDLPDQDMCATIKSLTP